MYLATKNGYPSTMFSTVMLPCKGAAAATAPSAISITSLRSLPGSNQAAALFGLKSAAPSMVHTSGNAVATPVARALGYALPFSLRGLSGDGPLLTLPEDNPMARDVPSPTIVTL